MKVKRRENAEQISSLSNKHLNLSSGLSCMYVSLYPYIDFRSVCTYDLMFVKSIDVMHSLVIDFGTVS